MIAKNFRHTMTRAITAALLVSCAWMSGFTSSATAASQRTFATAQKAADALIEAADKYDVATLVEILGPESSDLVSSQDPVRDKSVAAEFVKKAHEAQRLALTSHNGVATATLVVGNDSWPFAIPIVNKGGKWSFDTNEGKQEMLARRIGANELDAIQICRKYSIAQNEYALALHDGSDVHQYAQKIISTPGKQDGLFWENSNNTPGGPISNVIAKAIEEGYSADKASPFHGYYFKILKGQGSAAPLGELDYMVNGAMIGGFALVAAPAQYKVTGIKTFMVSYDGVIYEKDLGPDSLESFKKIDRFNPDKTWSRTKKNWIRDGDLFASVE